MSIEQLLTQATQESDAFAKASGLQCKSGCGACCRYPHMETTIAEMMPMAKHLWDTAQADDILTRLEQLPSVSPCAMYQADPVNPDKGHCHAYAYRPGICRLFGFGARVDKNGHKQLVTCKVIKESYPIEIVKAELGINSGQYAPLISDHTMKVFSVDPHLGKETLPINYALMKAVERIGLKRSQEMFSH